MVQLIEFDEQLIGDGYEYTIGVSAVDLTCNGYPDLVSTDTGVGLYWYENTGTGNFIKHVIHKKENEWLERHAIADINNDGKPEIINIDNINGSVLWFEYDGDPRKADSWSYNYVCEGTLPGAYDVAVADFDQDGDQDIIAVAFVPDTSFFEREQWPLNSILWIEQTGLREFTPHALETILCDHTTADLADYDRDGDLDLVTGTITWAGISGIRTPPRKTHSITIWENRGPRTAVSESISTKSLDKSEQQPRDSCR